MYIKSNKTKMLSFTNLPDEIVRMIFLYLQNPEAKLISNEYKIYEKDHNYYYTKQSGYYLIKSIMPFSEYYFDRLKEPYEYNSFYEYPEHIHRRKYHIAYINSYFETNPVI